ncbi:hypothetical protein LP418_20385 [Nocardioides sp. B-3]|nr:hypothetical protein [Nocardioides sp. B-3]UUZ58508.1 hypothetical protein LP418_20385 [Nocardioides sp. B-3]
MEAHSRRRAGLRGPRPCVARARRGADRLHDRADVPRRDAVAVKDGGEAPQPLAARGETLRSGRARPRRRGAARAGSGSAARSRA